VQPSFVPARAKWWIENWTAEVIDQLISSISERKSSDLNIDFCAAIPLLTITGSFGISIEEALEVRAAVTSDGQDASTLARILLPVIAQRRQQPTEDLISVLVQAELTDEDGVTQTLSDIEVLSFGLLLLAAGSGTTWKQMGITLYALLTHPEVLESVRADPSMMRNVIEESLRWMPTDPVFARFAVRDTELGGLHIPKGSVVHICLAAANRDPARWDRPDEFDPTRELKPHLGFGQGPHTCLGMHVARAEMSHGIESLIQRFPTLRLDPMAPAPQIIGLYERGPDVLPVIYGET
jgi:cytochrome P450